MIAKGAARVDSLSAGNERQVLAYLARMPFENVFLSYVVREVAALHHDVRVAVDSQGVAGAGLFGSTVALAAESHVLPAFATLGHTRERAIVGARETVRAYWELVRERHAPARLVRDRQPLLAVDAGSLRPAPSHVRVRRAREDEWAIVARNSAEMISGEIEADARGEMPEFGAGIRHMIRLGLWWVGEENGHLCFFCNVGCWSDESAQLQGIWTPPEFRGRGVATSAFGEICKTLLCVVPSLSLYVNDFNAPARALYARLGFHEVGELQTLLF